MVKAVRKIPKKVKDKIILTLTVEEAEVLKAITACFIGSTDEGNPRFVTDGIYWALKGAFVESQRLVKFNDLNLVRLEWRD